MDDDAIYWQYHAIAKDAILSTVLNELRALVTVPEPALLRVILARIDALEEDIAPGAPASPPRPWTGGGLGLLGEDGG